MLAEMEETGMSQVYVVLYILCGNLGHLYKYNLEIRMQHLPMFLSSLCPKNNLTIFFQNRNIK